MMAQPLPYDMGGAGDLLKHGVLAEFTQWWCQRHTTPLRFADPFGGRPWVAPPVPRVAERVKALAGCALFTAQPHPDVRYYGSGHLVRQATQAVGQQAEVLVSDRDPAALHDLVTSGLTPLQHPGFDPANGFSILTTEIDVDVVLIDPFASFLWEEAPMVLPQVGTVSQRRAIVVFVLIQDPMNVDGRRYTTLKSHHLAHAWTLSCPPLQHTGVKDESGYSSEVLLVAPQLLAQPTAAMLQDQLARYARRLTEVLEVPVRFSVGVRPELRL
jgi:hypothetical protein